MLVLTPGFANHLALVTFFGGNVLKVEGGSDTEVPYEPLPESRQRIMEDLDYQIQLP